MDAIIQRIKDRIAPKLKENLTPSEDIISDEIVDGTTVITIETKNFISYIRDIAKLLDELLDRILDENTRKAVIQELGKIVISYNGNSNIIMDTSAISELDKNDYL